MCNSLEMMLGKSYCVTGSHLPKKLTEEMNRRISIVFSMGVPFASAKELEPGGMNCELNDKNSLLGYSPLEFADLTFTLMSHGVLLSFCVWVFLAEIIHQRFWL